MGEAALQLEAEGREFTVVHDHSQLLSEVVNLKWRRREINRGLGFLVVIVVMMSTLGSLSALGDIISACAYTAASSLVILYACYIYARRDVELQVDTANASCGNPGDEAMIRERLQARHQSMGCTQ